MQMRDLKYGYSFILIKTKTIKKGIEIIKNPYLLIEEKEEEKRRKEAEDALILDRKLREDNMKKFQDEVQS